MVERECGENWRRQEEYARYLPMVGEDNDNLAKLVLGT